tara:strand:- start:111 stop:944 length:834 start_codon:yes stop_codon:yes gene_type:complete
MNLQKIIFFLLFLLITSCSSNPVSTQLEFSVLEKYFNYNLESKEINAYCLIDSKMDQLLMVSVSLVKSDNESEIISFDLLLDNEHNNQSVFIGSTSINNLEIGDYYMMFTVLDSDSSSQIVEQTETQNISPPFPPEIIEVIMNSSIQLDPTEWIYLPVNLYGNDLNGIDDILRVEYKIRGMLVSECTGVVEEYPEYTNLGNTNWVLDFQDIVNNSFFYYIDIPFRPIDGSALLDEDEEIIFPASDCGKIGEIYFQFTIIDQSGLTDEINDIYLEIGI